MSKHWQKAQEAARKEGGSNFIFLPNNKALFVGSQERGWIIQSSVHNLKLEAQTAQGVELALEELAFPPPGIPAFLPWRIPARGQHALEEG